MDKKSHFQKKTGLLIYVTIYVIPINKQDWNSVTDRPLDWLTSVDSWHAKIPTISPFMQKSQSTSFPVTKHIILHKMVRISKQTDWNSVTDRLQDWLTSVDNRHAKIFSISSLHAKVLEYQFSCNQTYNSTQNGKTQ